jgi:hypothetical protein
MAYSISKYPLEPAWVHDFLRSPFLEALENIPAANRAPVIPGELYQTREEAVTRLKDEAFSRGFVLVCTGGGPLRSKIRCCQQGSTTQNKRKLTEETRKRKTTVQASGCPFAIYVSHSQKNQKWQVGFTNPNHNHGPLQDPFSHTETKERHPNYLQTIAAAEVDRKRQISYRKATARATDSDFCLTKKQFYNLMGSARKLTPSEEAQALLKGLQAADFHTMLAESYELDPVTGQRIKRVIDQIWTASDQQITLGRRFISRYAYMADSTFSTNSLRLLLFTCVGITNTGLTFPVSYSFIRAEAKDAFLFAEKCMQQFVWQDDCPPPAIGIADQGAGFIAALAQLSGGDGGAAARAHAVARMGGIGAATQGGDITRLQLCEFHVQAAILRHLTDTRGYNAESREKLRALTWEYILSSSMWQLEQSREKLIRGLRARERTYLDDNWISKEHQFVRVYTAKYPNLGANSTQRSESFNAKIKTQLTSQTPIHEACNILARTTQAIVKEVYQKEDRSKMTSLVTLDKSFFYALDRKVTHYALDLLGDELQATYKWIAAVTEGRPTKATARNQEGGGEGEARERWEDAEGSGSESQPESDETDDGDESEEDGGRKRPGGHVGSRGVRAQGPANGPPLPDVNYEPICLLAHSLPLRYGLPCRCWMYHCIYNGTALPLSAVDPRWHIKGPDFVRSWVMSLYEPLPDSETDGAPPPPRNRRAGDIFQQDGRQVVLNAALDINRLQEQLPGPDSLKLAAWFKTTTAEGIREFTTRNERRQQLPTEVPKPLPTQKELRRTGKVLLASKRAEEDAKRRETAAKKAKMTAPVSREDEGDEMMGVWAAVDVALAATGGPVIGEVRSEGAIAWQETERLMRAARGGEEKSEMIIDLSDDENVSIDNFEQANQLTESVFERSGEAHESPRHTPTPPTYSPITQPALPPPNLLTSPSFSLQEFPYSFQTSPITIRVRRGDTKHGRQRAQSPCPDGSNPKPGRRTQSAATNDSNPPGGQKTGQPSQGPSRPPVVSSSSSSSPKESTIAIANGKRARKPSRKVFSQQERQREAAAQAGEPQQRKRRTREAKEEADREAKRCRASKEEEKRERKAREEASKEAARQAKETERKENRARKEAEVVAAKAQRAAEKSATEQKREATRREGEAEKAATKATKQWQQRLQKAAAKGERPKEDVSQPRLETIVID